MISNIILRRLCLSSPRMAAIRLSTTSSTTTQTEDYFTKNEKLKRPLSPFIVYKLQLTSTLSFTHRMTGLGLSVLLYGGGIAAFFSSQTNFSQVVQYISGNVSPTLLLALKVLTGISLIICFNELSVNCLVL